jgi:hypothetical protein
MKSQILKPIYLASLRVCRIPKIPLLKLRILNRTAGCLRCSSSNVRRGSLRKCIPLVLGEVLAAISILIP